MAIVLGAVAASVGYHLTIPAAKVVARNTANDLVSDAILGRLEIGSVQELQLDRVVARNVTFYDPEDNAVITGDRVVVVFDYRALLGGTLRFAHGTVEGGTLTLIDNDEGTPTFIDGFGTPGPPSNEPGIDTVVDDMRISGIRVTGSVLGLEGLVVENASAHMRMSIDGQAEHGFRLQIFGASGTLVAPFPYQADIEHVAGEIRDVPELGTSIWARVSTEEGDLAEAALRYRIPEGGSADELDLIAHLQPVHAERLHETGFEWAEPLRGELRGYVRLQGPPDDLTLRTWLDTIAGQVGVQVRLPSQGTVIVDVEAPGNDLGELFPDLEGLRLAGNVRLEIPPEGEPQLVATLAPFQYQGVEVPPLQLRARITDNGYAIDQARTEYPGAELEASGFVGEDGSIDLRTRGQIREISRDPNGRVFVPGVRGAISFDMDISAGPLLSSPVLRGRWVFRNLAVGPARVARLVAVGWVGGELSRPDLDLGLEAEGVRVDQIDLGSGDGRLAGQAGSYATRLDLRNQDRRIAWQGTLEPFDVVRLDLPDLTIEARGKKWEGFVRDLRYSGRVVEVSRLMLRSGAANIDATGRYDSRGDDQLVASISEFQLAELRPWLGDAMPDVEGTIELRVESTGDLEAVPTIEIDGQLSEGRAGPVDHLGGALLISYGPGEDGAAELEADGRISTGNHGSLDLRLQGQLDTSLSFVDSLTYGAYTLRAETQNLDVAFFETLVEAEALPQMRGLASGVVEVEGSPLVFDFNGEVAIPALYVEGWPMFGIESRFGFEAGSLIGRVEVLDNAGELIELEASTSIDLASLIADPSLFQAVVQNIPWRAAARIPQRGLGTLPEPIQELVPGLENFEGTAHITLSGGALDTRADLIAQLEWIGELDYAQCGVAARPRAHIDARLRNGQTEAIVDAFLGGTRALHLTAEAATPVELWMQDRSAFQIPATSLEAFLNGAPLHQVPVICEVMAGPVTAHLVAEKLFTDHPRAEIDISSDEVYARHLRAIRADTGDIIEEAERTPNMAVRVSSVMTHRELRADTSVQWWNGGETSLRGEVPIQWSASDIIPVLDDEASLSASANLFATPLEAILFWLPSIGHSAGMVEGDVVVLGTIADPVLRGELSLEDGHVELRALGQRLNNVSGAFLFEEDRITLQGLQALDGEGIVRIAGDAELDGFAPSAIHLRLDADDFPFRQEGSTIATATGATRFDAELLGSELRGEITVERLEVQLPESAGRNPQDLEEHPDIRLVGAEAPEVVADPYTVRLRVDGTRPFTVASAEFSAEVSALLDLLYIDSVPSVFALSGDVEIRSGQLEMYGKEFVVRTGSMHFEPEDGMDPNVNLVAVHSLRSRPGDTVTVQATGRLSDPRVTFTSTVTSDQSQILSMLVSGQVRESTFDEANQQAQAFLLGVASGLATLTLREKIGAAGYLIPELGIDTQNRIRFAYSFDDLLPEALQRVITSVHLEGIVNAGADNGTSSGSTDATTSGSALNRLGVLIELGFPRSLVFTTTLSQPSQSFDLTWQP